MQQAALNFEASPLAQARAIGQTAQELATARAEREEPDFRARAEAAILAKLSMGPVPGEDLTDHVAACGVSFADGRALGSIYASLRRRGLIVVVGSCPRRKGHGGQGGSIYAIPRTYEAFKASWLAANPGATAEAVELACQHIAENLGV